MDSVSSQEALAFIRQRGLIEIHVDASGWVKVYIDPITGHRWQLTYPQGDTHGGGPPLLSKLPVSEP